MSAQNDKIVCFLFSHSLKLFCIIIFYLGQRLVRSFNFLTLRWWRIHVLAFSQLQCLFVPKCSSGFLESLYPDLVCLGSVVSVLFCWLRLSSALDGAGSFRLLLGLLLPGIPRLESLEREFILSEESSCSVLFIGVPSKQISKQEFPNHVSAQPVKPIPCSVGRIQHWMHFSIFAQLIRAWCWWCQGCGLDAHMGPPLKSWARWSLCVPSTQNILWFCNILYWTPSMYSQYTAAVSDAKINSLWKHSSSNCLPIWILFWS